MVKAKTLAAAFVAVLDLAVVWTASADVEVWLMRHGETAWNRAKILQGTIDSPALTPRGVAMAEATAEGLKAAGIAFDRTYSSPLVRARQTARIVAGAEPRTDARLGEMCFGRYEGVRYGKDAWPDQNLRFLFEDPARYVPQGEGAETFDQVGARLKHFLEKEIAPLDGKAGRVLCVSHSQALAYMKEKHPEIRRVCHIGRDLDAEGVLARRDEYGLFGVNMPIDGRRTSERDVAFLRQNGLWVSLWFVQTEADVAAYSDTEADAFVTDRVTDVRAAYLKMRMSSGR